MHSIFKIFCSTLFLLLLAGSAAADYTVGDWTVIQLTDDDISDYNPVVSGNTVTWMRMGSSSTYQIYMWRDGVTTQLSDDTLSNTNVRIDGNLIAWEANSQIFYYDGATHTLTFPGWNNSGPEVSQGAIAWLGPGGGNYADIHYFDGGEDIQLTDVPTVKGEVRISGSKITWQGAGSTPISQIFYYDGADVIQLTDNTYNSTYPQISDGGPGDFHLTYETLLDGYWEIMHFDGTETVNLSNTPNLHEYSNRTCGNRTIWLGTAGGSMRVMLYDGVSVNPISPAGASPAFLAVSDSMIAWIFSTSLDVYDGSVITRLNPDPAMYAFSSSLDGGTVVWSGSDGYDREIFMAYKTPPASPVPEAGNLVMAKAHPNPFNPATEITFAVDQAAAVSVKIFDLRGHLVADLGERSYDSGNHSVTWRGQNRQGQAVPAGVYFYAVETGRDRQMGKVTLVE